MRVPDGPEALVRIHQVNTRRLIHARFPVAGGRAVVEGDYTLDGVSGSGARVRLDFLEPGGTRGRGLFPSGTVSETIELPGAGAFRATLVDAASPAMFIPAAELGLTGTETPEEIEARPGLMALLDRLRRAGGVRMGLAATEDAVPLAGPRIALVAPPVEARTLDGRTIAPGQQDILVRMLSMERVHRATPLTGGMALGIACLVPGTVPHALARPAAPGAEEVRVCHPSGLLSVGARLSRDAQGGYCADAALVFRTARRLMQGEVAVPARLLPG